MEHQQLYDRLSAKLEATQVTLDRTRGWTKRMALFREIKLLTADVFKLRCMVPSDPTEEDTKWLLEHVVKIPFDLRNFWSAEGAQVLRCGDSWMNDVPRYEEEKPWPPLPRLRKP